MFSVRAAVNKILGADKIDRHAANVACRDCRTSKKWKGWHDQDHNAISRVVHRTAQQHRRKITPPFCPDRDVRTRYKRETAVETPRGEDGANERHEPAQKPAEPDRDRPIQYTHIDDQSSYACCNEARKLAAHSRFFTMTLELISHGAPTAPRQPGRPTAFARCAPW